MERILAKTIIALAFGLLVGVIVGNLTMQTKYFYNGENRVYEIAEVAYQDDCGRPNEIWCIKRKVFNLRLSLLSGIVSGGVLCILLLYKELRFRDI